MKNYFVYLLTNKPRGIFYVGVTDDLVRRITEHRSEVMDGFTKKYSVHRLVYYEVYDNAEQAIKREKRLKRWNRNWKIEAVEKDNPEWNDLYNLVCEQYAEDPRVRSQHSLSGELTCTQ